MQTGESLNLHRFESVQNFSFFNLFFFVVINFFFAAEAGILLLICS